MFCACARCRSISWCFSTPLPHTVLIRWFCAIPKASTTAEHTGQICSRARPQTFQKTQLLGQCVPRFIRPDRQTDRQSDSLSERLRRPEPECVPLSKQKKADSRVGIPVRLGLSFCPGGRSNRSRCAITERKAGCGAGPHCASPADGVRVATLGINTLCTTPGLTDRTTLVEIPDRAVHLNHKSS